MNFTVNSEHFRFNYLQDYAGWILDTQLREFVLVGIRFSREAKLPLLKPLSKFSEDELVQLSIESNRLMLEALRNNNIAAFIEENSRKWIDNAMEIVDKEDIVAEDLTLGFFLRRKIFSHFLDAYTKNVVLQKFIISEVDVYTTQEELIAYNLYLKIQQEKLILANADLAFHKELLLEAQQLGGMGSYSINTRDRSKSYYSPEYKKIFEIEDATTFDKFLEWVHADDRENLSEKIQSVYATGGIFEVSYRYNKSGKEKRIWSRGFVLQEEGKPIYIRGIAREVTE